MWLLSTGHGCVDVYQGAVAALVPFLVADRGLSFTEASWIVLAAAVASSVVQPGFGAVADRWPSSWSLPVSILVSGIGVGLAGVAGSYTLTLLAVALSGIGVAAYHPEAARVARVAGRGSHAAMSWFAVGGNLGFVAAPWLVAAVVAVGGLRASPLLTIPAVAGAAVCAVALRRIGPTTVVARPSRSGRTGARDDWPSFTRLTGAIVCRSIVFAGLSAFLPLYVRDRIGGDAVAGTVALFVLYLGGAAGTVAGGWLATRFGRLRVVRWSYASTVLAVAGVVLVPGPLVYVFVALTSLGLYVPFSLHVTLGQDYLPRQVGMAGGVTLGLAVSAGGAVSPLLGLLADGYSLKLALAPLVVLPAVALLLLRPLAEPEPPDDLTGAGGPAGSDVSNRRGRRGRPVAARWPRRAGPAR